MDFTTIDPAETNVNSFFSGRTAKWHISWPVGCIRRTVVLIATEDLDRMQRFAPRYGILRCAD
jgi:hypothetical protein